MNKYTKKYKKIADELIKKSFPSLKDEKIIILELPIFNFGGILYLHNFSIIVLTPRARRASIDVIKGTFAHELVHLERFKRKSFLKLVLSSKNIRSEERATDKLAIRKGYGRESYVARKFIYKSHEKRIKKYYLTPEEIKLYAKKIGKW